LQTILIDAEARRRAPRSARTNRWAVFASAVFAAFFPTFPDIW
jgi:hypothetical protein